VTSPGVRAGALTPLEWKRKAIHAGMGLFALLLRWIDWRPAALLAAAALLFNLFAMPRIGRGIYRDATRRRDPGIVAYPAMVLLLVLLFRRELGLAAALWGMMALGDPAASISGRLLGGPTLPWNRNKRWSGMCAYFLAGTAAATALWAWVEPHSDPRLLFPVLLPVTALGAFLESLETGLDDNWIPPVPCALLLAFLHSGMVSAPAAGSWAGTRWGAALAVNAAVGFVTFRLHILAPSGALAGSLVGVLVLALGGWPHYTVLWTFFLMGTVQS
jgi:dolichol kinase